MKIWVVNNKKQIFLLISVGFKILQNISLGKVISKSLIHFQMASSES